MCKLRTCWKRGEEHTLGVTAALLPAGFVAGPERALPSAQSEPAAPQSEPALSLTLVQTML